MAADLTAGKFVEIEATVAPEAKEALTADKMRMVWQSVIDTTGKYVRRGEPIVRKVPGNDLFDYPLTLERGKAHLQVTVNDRSQVTGLVLLPGDPTGEFGK